MYIHFTTFSHTRALTYGVSAAELFADDVVHVAVETEEDLDGVHLHLQGAGQVHHLSHTHNLSYNTSLHPVYILCVHVWWRYLALQRRLAVHQSVPGLQLVPGVGRHQHKVLVLHQPLLQVKRVQV